MRERDYGHTYEKNAESCFSIVACQGKATPVHSAASSGRTTACM